MSGEKRLSIFGDRRRRPPSEFFPGCRIFSGERLLQVALDDGLPAGLRGGSANHHQGGRDTVAAFGVERCGVVDNLSRVLFNHPQRVKACVVWQPRTHCCGGEVKNRKHTIAVARVQREGMVGTFGEATRPLFVFVLLFFSGRDDDPGADHVVRELHFSGRRARRACRLRRGDASQLRRHA